MVVLGYYDGPTEGIAECPEGHVAVIRMLDWDDQQDIRIFAVTEIPEESFDTLAALGLDSGLLGSCQVAPVRRILDKIRPPDYVIVCEDPLKIIHNSRAYPNEIDAELHDWFAEFGIARYRAE